MSSSHPRSSFLIVGAFAIALASATPAAAFAQGYDANAGVARMSLMRGKVTLQRGESGAPSAATVNAPVLPGDYVSTGGESRAEIELDALSALRLAANVQLRFTRLDRNERELQLAEGTVELRLLRDDAAPAQLDTPSIAIRPDVAGTYRVAVDAAGRTEVTVRSGRAEAIAAHETRVLLPGTTLYAEGSAADPVLRTGSAIALDEFDRFNTERDGPELHALADAYAPPGVAGIADLQTYGHWVSDAAYGTVWTPYAVPAGWAPYRDGTWSWYAPYGWTWVGYEPWGWAPYHYGRWYRHPHYGWCWIPARAVVPWSPALVSFVTFGGPRLGTIGWVPLAPFQSFTPWWGPTAYNVVTKVTYVGAAAPYGTTVISKQKFLEKRFRERVEAAPPAERRSVVVTNGTSAWARFSATRTAPVHARAVQVIDGAQNGGAAVQHTTGVWSRFDGSTEPRHAVRGTLPATRSDYVAPASHPQYVAPAMPSHNVAPAMPSHYVAPAPVQAAPAAPQYAPAHQGPAGESRPLHATSVHEHSASAATHHKP